MDPKLVPLVTVNQVGEVTHLRGVEVSPAMQFVTVLTEQPSNEPPSETSWALEGAYAFTTRLRSGAR